jgi:hypothetical protein
VADFNNPGRLDVAAASANNTLYVLTQIEPTLSAAPYSVNFGSIVPGRTVEKQVTITNIIHSTVALEGVSISTPGNDQGAFTVDNLCPSSLAPGASCQIYVTFNWTAGLQTATLKVTFPSLIGQSLEVPLSGTGLSFMIGHGF